MANVSNASIEQITKYLEDEEIKQEAYLNHKWAKTSPEPLPPTADELSFWKIAGLESSLFVVSAIGSAILSAIRTGGLFWLLEELLFQKFEALSWASGIFGFASMVAALMAFEGFLLAYGLTKGKESGKMEVSRTGLIVSLVTVMAAGIFSSFSIVTVSDGWQAFMNILLALITGGASAMVAYFSSENLGFILNHINAKRQEVQDQHQKNAIHWREQGIKSYNTARKMLIANASSYGQVNQSTPTPQPEVKQEEQKLSKTETANSWISEYVNKNNTLPTNQKVSDALSVAIGTAHTRLNQYIFDNQQELLSKGIVSQEKVNEVNAKLGGKQQPVSNYENSEKKITDFIEQIGTFPSSEELAQMSVGVNDVIKYVVENQVRIRNNNLLDEEIIQEAQSKYKE